MNIERLKTIGFRARKIQAKRLRAEKSAFAAGGDFASGDPPPARPGDFLDRIISELEDSVCSYRIRDSLLES